MNWIFCRRMVYDVEKISESIEVRRPLSKVASAKADTLPVKDSQATISEFAEQLLRRRPSSGQKEQYHVT